LRIQSTYGLSVALRLLQRVVEPSPLAGRVLLVAHNVGAQVRVEHHKAQFLHLLLDRVVAPCVTTYSLRNKISSTVLYGSDGNIPAETLGATWQIFKKK
jgi:hypothetical protein